MGDAASSRIRVAASPHTTRSFAAQRKAKPKSNPNQGSLEDVMNVYEREVRKPIGGLLGGQLLRALLVQVVQLKLLMEQEVEAVDRLLIRNDFNLQLMATVRRPDLHVHRMCTARAPHAHTVST